jgi:hypothetical protein
MKYLMLVVIEPDPDMSGLTDEELDVDPWVEENDRRGTRIMGERLRPRSEARTVRVRRGELKTTDGPFADTKEVIAGFDVLECAGWDEAVEIASKHPVAKFGLIELRQFWEGDED